MKFLCIPCDSPMKLQTVGPPEGGSLSVVYSCPECGYEMAMLTNAYETQVVQSLGVRIGPGMSEGSVERRELKVPVPRDVACHGRSARGCARRRANPSPMDVRRRSEAREHSRIRPPHGADRHRKIRSRAGGPGGGREDPRRGPRLLRHVRRRDGPAAAEPEPGAPEQR